MVGTVEVVDQSIDASAETPSILSKSSFIESSISCNATTEGRATRTATRAYSTSDAPLSLLSLLNIFFIASTLYDGQGVPVGEGRNCSEDYLRHFFGDL